MQEWFQQLVGPEYAQPVMWIALILILLVAVLIFVRIMRGVRSGTFVMGGRGRKTRLAVMDATAVDANRRLVLVRRDHVEHLLLIGGPNDLVVEASIGPVGALRRGEPARAEPTPSPEPAVEPSRPAQPVQPREREMPQRQLAQPTVQAEPERTVPHPTPPAPQRPAPAAPSSLDFAPAPVHTQPVRPQPQVQQPSTTQTRVEPSLATPAEPVQQPPQLVSAYKVQKGANSDSGWTLQHDAPGAAAPQQRPAGNVQAQPVARGSDIDEESLEDEMNRLLDDLSSAPR